MAYQASKEWAPNTKRVITPTVIQMEAVECGAAALGIILAYYGQFAPLEELRVDCGVSRDGSKASSLVLAARNRGLDAQGFRYELEQLAEVKVPFIVFWNFNHFLVVEGFSKDKVFLNDPATGPRTVSLEEFDQCFTGIVLTFETTPVFSPSGKAPSVVLSLKKRLKNNYDSILFLLLIGIILVIPGLLIPTFTKIFIDDYLVGSMSNWLGPILFGLMLTGLAKGLLVWMQSYYLLRFETKLDLRDSSSYFWHILHLPMAFFSQRGTGDLSSRILLNSKIASSLSRDVSRSFLNMFVASFYLLLMFLYTPSLTVCTLILAVINFLVLKKIIKIQHDKSLQMGISLGKFQSIAYNGLDSMETLKASGRENDYFNKLMGIQVKIINAYQELQDKVTSIRTTPLLLNGINTAILLGLGSILIIKGYMSIGMLMAFQILADGFLAPISDLVAITGVIQGLSGDMAKVDDVMQAKALPKESAPDKAPVVQKFEGYLSLENISFGYNVTQKPLIQGFSLTIKPGQRIALIGGSGSGKSTIAKLISRLYSPWEGSIKIDDRLITDISMIEYAGSVSFVDQEIRLFKGSIADNIRMWDSSITEEDMIQAAKDACIHQDITQRDKAYNTEVSERGANFSGGQCQRIEIARALAKNPRVLIMDEATSALDPITEEIISNNIRHRGCTCIIIAHRLSTIKDCDEIIVLSQGEVVERGTHQELIKHSGHYSQLIKMEASS